MDGCATEFLIVTVLLNVQRGERWKNKDLQDFNDEIQSVPNRSGRFVFKAFYIVNGSKHFFANIDDKSETSILACLPIKNF
jgi:hypothetical protein